MGLQEISSATSCSSQVSYGLRQGCPGLYPVRWWKPSRTEVAQPLWHPFPLLDCPWGEKFPFISSQSLSPFSLCPFILLCTCAQSLAQSSRLPPLRRHWEAALRPPQNRPFSRLNEPHSLSLRGQDVFSSPDCLGGSLLALLHFINALMISFGHEEGRTSTEVRKGIVLRPAGGGVPPSWMGWGL